MGVTKPQTPMVLSTGQIDQAMELVVEAGWNQLPADWQQFIQHGQVLGVHEGDVLVATAAIMPYDKDFAWISMVLTRKAWRGRGLGTGLLKSCIAQLEAEGRTAWLDATPAGEPIYRALGFQPVETYQRWQGSGRGSGAASGAGSVDLAAVDLANAAFGADRSEFLCSLAERCPAAHRRTGDTVCFGRDGRLATQIGPVVGSNEEPIIDLIDATIDAIEGPVFLDVSDHCKGLAAHLRTLGFTVQRPFLRMSKGPHAPRGDPSRTAVIAGPEFG